MKTDNSIDNQLIPSFHGEITITPVHEIPEGKVSLVKETIIGHSETGHHHMLTSVDQEFEQIMVDNQMYIRLFDVARVWHKKDRDIHEPKLLAPGLYKIGEKTEYNPLTKTIQRVFD